MCLVPVCNLWFIIWSERIYQHNSVENGTVLPSLPSYEENTWKTYVGLMYITCIVWYFSRLLTCCPEFIHKVKQLWTFFSNRIYSCSTVEKASLSHASLISPEMPLPHWFNGKSYCLTGSKSPFNFLHWRG